MELINYMQDFLDGVIDGIKELPKAFRDYFLEIIIDNIPLILTIITMIIIWRKLN